MYPRNIIDFFQDVVTNIPEICELLVEVTPRIIRRMIQDPLQFV